MNLQLLLVLFVVAISGNPAALIFGREGTYIFAFIVLLLLWFRRPVAIHRTAIIFPAVIACLALIHLFSFGAIVLMASMGFLLKIGIGILSAIVIEDFFRKFVRVMAVLSLISLIFYVPFIFGIDFSGSLSFLNISLEARLGLDPIRHIGIHNFHHENELRNSGMFWEPGAFAGYLVLALFIVVTQIKNHSFSRWEISALICGLLSTQSTMGFIAGAIVAIYYIFNRFLSPRLELALPFISVGLLVLGGVFYFAVVEFDFLGDKIVHQLLSAQVGLSGHEITRFGNMIYDLEFIKQRPIIGWSGNPETRYSLDPDVVYFIAGQGSALTGFWVRFGFFGFFAFFGIMYIVQNNNFNSAGGAGLFLLIIVAALLVGEQYTNFPLIYAFLVAICRSDTTKPRCNISSQVKVKKVCL